MYNPFNQNFPYPQMPQFGGFRQPQYNSPQFIVKQVTSIEEARASMIDPLSTYLFVDSSTGSIYLKRLNNNGLSDFYTYKAEEVPQGDKTNPLDEINQRLSSIEKLLGGKNDKSIPVNADVAKSNTDGYAAAPKSESSVVFQSTTDGTGQIGGGITPDGRQYC